MGLNIRASYLFAAIALVGCSAPDSEPKIDITQPLELNIPKPDLTNEEITELVNFATRRIIRNADGSVEYANDKVRVISNENTLAPPEATVMWTSPTFEINSSMIWTIQPETMSFSREYQSHYQQEDSHGRFELSGLSPLADIEDYIVHGLPAVIQDYVIKKQRSHNFAFQFDECANDFLSAAWIRKMHKSWDKFIDVGTVAKIIDNQEKLENQLEYFLDGQARMATGFGVPFRVDSDTPDGQPMKVRICNSQYDSNAETYQVNNADLTMSYIGPSHYLVLENTSNQFITIHSAKISIYGGPISYNLPKNLKMAPHTTSRFMVSPLGQTPSLKHVREAIPYTLTVDYTKGFMKQRLSESKVATPAMAIKRRLVEAAEN